MVESTDNLDPLEQMEALVESSLPLLFEVFDLARKERVRNPVILLIDCEDEVGHEIAEAWQGSEAVEDAILVVHADDEDDDQVRTTVLARAMPWIACRREIPPLFPYLADSFERPPAASLFVVCVSAGGAGTFSVPFAARPDSR